MDIHFHYYGIKAIAHSAGFMPHEAETIAYASQYVDDATEHKGFIIDQVPEAADPQHIAGLFEPVCTAHRGLQYLACTKPEVQRLVYIPFHFVPPATRTNGNLDSFEYKVEPGAAFAKGLLLAAVEALKAAQSPDGRLSALIKTGIALHTYADTWAHQGFSGRQSSNDNDIQNRAVLRNDTWEELGLFERALYDVLPDIGHAEAGILPDASHIQFRYRRAADDAKITRDNTAQFMSAATRILDILCPIGGGAYTRDHLDKIQRCLADGGTSSDSRSVWSTAFPNAFADGLDYNRACWREEALKDGPMDWDRFDEKQFRGRTFRAKGDLKWFMFHVEAGIQRDQVIRRIPRVLG